jgi:hypothetical protein
MVLTAGIWHTGMPIRASHISICPILSDTASMQLSKLQHSCRHCGLGSFVNQFQRATTDVNSGPDLENSKGKQSRINIHVLHLIVAQEFDLPNDHYHSKTESTWKHAQHIFGRAVNNAESVNKTRILT